ncbi:hypothetical protein C8R44DRAFT_728868 [Mycena epipterygia]|nr:hypothetical protein C8R44DRAFT_728868 [Mycena epipterygia]
MALEEVHALLRHCSSLSLMTCSSLAARADVDATRRPATTCSQDVPYLVLRFADAAALADWAFVGGYVRREFGVPFARFCITGRRETYRLQSSSPLYPAPHAHPPAPPPRLPNPADAEDLADWTLVGGYIRREFGGNPFDVARSLSYPTHAAILRPVTACSPLSPSLALDRLHLPPLLPRIRGRVHGHWFSADVGYMSYARTCRAWLPRTRRFAFAHGGLRILRCKERGPEASLGRGARLFSWAPREERLPPLLTVPLSGSRLPPPRGLRTEVGEVSRISDAEVTWTQGVGEMCVRLGGDMRFGIRVRRRGRVGTWPVRVERGGEARGVPRIRIWCGGEAWPSVARWRWGAFRIGRHALGGIPAIREVWARWDVSAFWAGGVRAGRGEDGDVAPFVVGIGRAGCLSWEVEGDRGAPLPWDAVADDVGLERMRSVGGVRARGEVAMEMSLFVSRRPCSACWGIGAAMRRSLSGGPAERRGGDGDIAPLMSSRGARRGAGGVLGREQERAAPLSWDPSRGDAQPTSRENFRARETSGWVPDAGKESRACGVIDRQGGEFVPEIAPWVCMDRGPRLCYVAVPCVDQCRAAGEGVHSTPEPPLRPSAWIACGRGRGAADILRAVLLVGWLEPRALKRESCQWARPI